MQKYDKNKIGAPVGVKCGDRKNLMLNFVPKARAVQTCIAAIYMNSTFRGSMYKL